MTCPPTSNKKPSWVTSVEARPPASSFASTSVQDAEFCVSEGARARRNVRAGRAAWRRPSPSGRRRSREHPLPERPWCTSRVAKRGKRRAPRSARLPQAAARARAPRVRAHVAPTRNVGVRATCKTVELRIPSRDKARGQGRRGVKASHCEPSSNVSSAACRRVLTQQMVNIPKTRRTYCKGKTCRKHTYVCAAPSRLTRTGRTR